jgi:putative nucleotidyltransferase-like protein
MSEPNPHIPSAAASAPGSGDAERTVEAALVDAVAALERASIPYVVSGGMAANLWARPRSSKDADIIVHPDAADAALAACAAGGFDTEETDPRWLYKAIRNGTWVDLMFSLKGGIFLDSPMLDHAVTVTVGAQPMRVIAPEDLVVIKAVSAEEQSPRHWGDALGLLAHAPIDWDYLVERSRSGIRRVLSLLVYADSSDILVPPAVIDRVFRLAYGGDDG